jgi:ribosomal protein S18
MTPGTYVARMRALTKSVTERNARIRPRTITEARPGDTVRFECSDCDEIYRQTIIPRRDVARALVRLSEGGRVAPRSVGGSSPNRRVHGRARQARVARRMNPSCKPLQFALDPAGSPPT